MASRILPRLATASAPAATIAGSLAYTWTRHPIRCDAAPRPDASHARVHGPADCPDPAMLLPRKTREGGRLLTARIVRQCTLGSMAGLWLGLTLRIFSRALAFSVGAGILFFQWLAHEGYHVFPTRWLRRKIRGVRVGRILEENAPFKLSMASTVLLAAFGEFQPDE